MHDMAVRMCMHVVIRIMTDSIATFVLLHYVLFFTLILPWIFTLNILAALKFRRSNQLINKIIF